MLYQLSYTPSPGGGLCQRRREIKGASTRPVRSVPDGHRTGTGRVPGRGRPVAFAGARA